MDNLEGPDGMHIRDKSIKFISIKLRSFLFKKHVVIIIWVLHINKFRSEKISSDFTSSQDQMHPQHWYKINDLIVYTPWFKYNDQHH